MMRLWITHTFILIGLALSTACSKNGNTIGGSNPGEPSMERDLNPSSSNKPTVENQGSDQGREGGHFVICTEEAPIPVDGEYVTSHEPELGDPDDYNEYVYFIDYVLTIKTQSDLDSLLPFGDTESDEDRLEKVVNRLDTLYKNDPKMNEIRVGAISFRSTFIDDYGTSEFWVEDLRAPQEIPRTEDVTKENLGDSKSVIETHCGDVLFQAVTYKYERKEASDSAPKSRLDVDEFLYSRYFQSYSSRMQKSFRNVHEMLRYLTKDETEQIQNLTAYFHSKEFFDPSKNNIVRNKIAEIAQATAKKTKFTDGKSN